LLPFKRAVEAVKILEKENLFVTDKLIISQSEKHPPFRLMIKGGHQKKETKEKEISITNADRQYTKEFTRLLQDYYLYL
jgi:tRNA1Val (adenine37-N6)-methyltransferase